MKPTELHRLIKALVCVHLTLNNGCYKTPCMGVLRCRDCPKVAAQRGIEERIAVLLKAEGLAF